ncbi:F-box/kelch-repeat protein At3g23880 [Lathyrus oleraceus]|uniref:F-box domain-containing protein n=1 Tax=Pisum sativum TaxID=3888 RepID=A0A9D4VXH6_PEA|nr:F-box/kelch-repeat protein At3g23880-like [Pisum sativum]KAI5390679.1 hypothetical protein KIW84_075833 [Pisum sativum]
MTGEGSQNAASTPASQSAPMKEREGSQNAASTPASQSAPMKEREGSQNAASTPASQSAPMKEREGCQNIASTPASQSAPMKEREGCQNAASTPASQSAPHVSLDILVEILSRLRVKQLITLRCVCKAWNDLISGDSNLAKKHLLVSTCNQDCHHIITSSQHMPPEFLLSASPFTSIFGPTSYPTQFRYPLTEILEILAQNNLYDGPLATSVCDRILCFRLPNYIGILCNPSIRKLKILPPLNSSVISYSLGYDCNNYKVVSLTKGIGRVHVPCSCIWLRFLEND